MQARILLVSGWAYGSGALAPLAESLGRSFRSGLLAVADLEPSESGSYGEALAARVQEPTVLVGWSMGGMAAIEAVLLAPERVSALVLIGSTPRFCRCEGFPHGAAGERLNQMTMRFQGEPGAALREFFLLASGTEGKGLVDSALSLGRDRLLEGLGYLDRADLRSPVESIRHPTLVCHGKKDRVVPWRAAPWIVDRIPGSECRLFPDAGHDLPVREPGRVAAQVREFLRSRLG